MAYENKIAIESCVKKVHEQQGTIEKTRLIINEIEEVYSKAKVFDEIKAFVNGNSVENINNDLYEAGYVQACNDILNIIQKNDMEDE